MDAASLQEELSLSLKTWLSQCVALEQIPTQNKREDLRNASRALLTKLVSAATNDTADGSNVPAKSAHEQALASIIKELGPAFAADSSTHQSRICALNVVVGALEACRETSISNVVMKMLVTFLMMHCGPIEDDNSGDDLDEQIRDVSVEAITALLSSQPPADCVDSIVAEALTLRADAAQRGVKYRCALPENDDDAMDYDYGFGENNRNNDNKPAEDFRSGLSHLPRSKRSLCFSLVQSAINGTSNVLRNESAFSALSNESKSALQKRFAKFASFAATCLHGESDPRCLMQLLQLLNSLQRSLEPLFKTSTTSVAVFPSSDIFDAVAPYFPVQFTPPPKNPYGITRDGLHEELMGVLTFVGFDDDSRKHKNHTMLNLAAGLFVEQLFPTGMDQDDEPPSVFEQIEAIAALNRLIFPSNEDSHEDECKHIDNGMLRILSKALVNVHEESSIIVATNGHQATENKQLAQDTRTFVSKLAFGLEKSGHETGWTIFVADPITIMSRGLGLSPATCKTNIAYIACLEASGGVRTLRICITKCMDPLAQIIQEQKASNENIVAACYGIGAFFSACRVAMETAAMQGLAFHPHPLEKLSASIFLSINAMVNFNVDLEEFPKILPTMIAAVRTLESVLVASPTEHFEPDDLDQVCHFIQTLTHVVLSKSGDETMESKELKKACAMTLGYILGNGLQKENTTTDMEDDSTKPSSTVLRSEVICAYCQNDVLPKLLKSAVDQSTHSTFLEMNALALACSNSKQASERIVSEMLTCLKTSLETSGPLADSSQKCASALSHILRNGSNLACRAFHANDAPSVLDILELLSASSDPSNSKQGELIDSVDNLALPATPEEELERKRFLQASAKISAQLIPAYSSSAMFASVRSIISRVSNVLPPLSQNDALTLCLLLPLMAEALNTINRETKHAQGVSTFDIEDDLLKMVKDLTDFALGDEYDGDAKDAAASCLHAILVSVDKKKPCPIAPIQKEVVLPALTAATQGNGGGNTMAIADLLQMTGLLASAAAIRGGNSSPTADQLSRFLVELACSGQAPSPTSQESVVVVDFSSAVFINVIDVDVVKIMAASAYGSILSIRSMSPFTRQRLSHVALKCLQSAVSNFDQSVATDHKEAPSRIGIAAVASHVVCCGNITKMGDATSRTLSTMVVMGLSMNLDMRNDEATKNLKLLVLAAVTKIVTVGFKFISDRVLLIRGLLKMYATAHPRNEIAPKLLALQALEAIGKESRGKDGTDAIRQAVVTLLSTALNHPSGILRQAAVDVRNAWYLDQ